MTRQNLIDMFIAIFQNLFIDCSHNLYLLFKIYLYELIIHVILMKLCQFLIAINFNLIMLSIREGRESLFR